MEVAMHRNERKITTSGRTHAGLRTVLTVDHVATMSDSSLAAGAALHHDRTGRPLTRTLATKFRSCGRAARRQQPNRS
jgi:hypothetical protein